MLSGRCRLFGELAANIQKKGRTVKRSAQTKKRILWGFRTEFGAKLSVSCVEGYVWLEKISWENYNESGDFISQVEAYKEFTGVYSSSVHADKIYRTRANRAWCKERGIRLSGSPLGKLQGQVSLQAKKPRR